MADETIDASQLLELAAELGVETRRVAEGAHPIVKEHAIKLRNDWRDNARSSSGTHGRHYPKAITAEQIPLTDAVEWEVGPESALPQGGMGRGFEFGSVNQPPHLDGAQAARKTEPQFIKAMDDLARSFLQ